MLVTTMAHAGVRCTPLTRLSSDDPGMPSSRAKAYHMRPIDVTEARPQSHMAPPIRIAITFVSTGVRFLATM